MPDSLILSRADDLPKVKAFRERYLDPYVHVERLHGLDVNYQVRQCELKGESCVTDTSTIEPYMRLMIRMDSNANPQKIVLWCVDGEGDAHFDKIEHNIVERLRTDTDTCI